MRASCSLSLTCTVCFHFCSRASNITLHSSWISCCCQAERRREVSKNAPWESHRPVNNSSAPTLTLAAVPAKAPRHVRGLDGPFLAGLQKHKQPLQLVRDAGNWILFRLLKLPAGRWRQVNYTTWKCGTESLAKTSMRLPSYL